MGAVGRARRTRLVVVCCTAAFVLALHRLFELRRLRAVVVQRGRGWLEARYRYGRTVFAHHLETQVEAALDRAATHVAAMLKDRSMPAVLQRAIDSLVDGLLPDIKHESFRVLDEHFMQTRNARVFTPPSLTALSPLSPRRSAGQQLTTTSGDGSSSQRGGSDEPTRLERLHLLLRRGRAIVLHTLWPHDKSVWCCLRSSSWWALHLLGVLPHPGSHCWWLLLASLVDKSDEYQLCAFIIALRGSHFVTLGVTAALYGCMQAYRCAALPDSTCKELAPSIGPPAVAFWLVQLGVTIRAFSLLPHSQKKGQRVVERRGRLSLAARAALTTGQAPHPGGPSANTSSGRLDGGNGGRLGPMGGFLWTHVMWIDGGLAALVLLASLLATLLLWPDRACVTSSQTRSQPCKPCKACSPRRRLPTAQLSATVLESRSPQGAWDLPILASHAPRPRLLPVCAASRARCPEPAHPHATHRVRRTGAHGPLERGRCLLHHDGCSRNGRSRQLHADLR